MPTYRSWTGTDQAILTAIIRGQAWNRKSVRNPHFRKHCRVLNLSFLRDHALLDDLRESALRLFTVVGVRSRLLFEDHSLKSQLVPVLLRMVAYRERWYRSPESWAPDPMVSAYQQWQSLLKHLFVKWPVPRFFESAWKAYGDLRHIERDWYCHVSSGGNWKKARGMPRGISNRAIHEAMNAPADLSLREALKWGQVRAVGASPDLVEEVLASRMVNDLRNQHIWMRLLEKVSGDPVFQVADFGVIADVLLELLEHGHLKRAALLVNRPLRELLSHCRARWQTLLDCAQADGLRFRQSDLRDPGLREELRRIVEVVWEPMLHEAPVEIKQKAAKGRKVRHWQVTEYCRQTQLLTEGQAMNHCVAQYWHRCLRGVSAIFSIKEAHESSVTVWEHRLTIEVAPKDREIVQVRGRWNRRPDQEECGVLLEWADQNQLNLSPSMISRR